MLVHQKCKYDSQDLIECNGNLQNIRRCKSPHGSRRIGDICKAEFSSFENVQWKNMKSNFYFVISKSAHYCNYNWLTITRFLVPLSFICNSITVRPSFQILSQPLQKTDRDGSWTGLVVSLLLAQIQNQIMPVGLGEVEILSTENWVVFSSSESLSLSLSVVLFTFSSSSGKL